MPDVEHIPEPEAYALGALEPSEMAAAARHLADCPLCASEVEHFARVASLLPYALGEPGSADRHSPRALRPGTRWIWGLLAAASIAALIWGGSFALSGMRDRNVADAERTVVSMIATRPQRELALQPMSPAARSSHAMLMVGEAGGMKTAIVVSHLPPAPARMSYRLWYEHSGHGGAGPALMSLPDGTMVCVVPGDLSQRYDRVGIVLMGDGHHELLFDAAIKPS
ncbi:MAG TPA: hypothetical protein VNJ51_14570 [Candidatus Dormibacteraeota bacterium]|nr:hypothetical protein [Candidatus Dormibacteraeota bacterium]